MEPELSFSFPPMDAPQGTFSCASAIHLGRLLTQAILAFGAMPRLLVSNSAFLPNCASNRKARFSVAVEGRMI